MSEESGPLKELKIQLEAISKEINKAKITIKEAPRSSKMMLGKPFVSLEIPNKLFLLWNNWRNLQGRRKVNTEQEPVNLTDLVNKSIIGNLISIKTETRADERIRKSFTVFLSKYKKMGGVQRNKTLSKVTNMLLYEDEILRSTRRPPLLPTVPEQLTIATVAKADKKGAVCQGGKLYI